MKNILLTLSSVVFLFTLPIFSLAHGTSATDPNSENAGFMMMEHIEDEVLGDDIHEEMEQLMTKVMSGSLTDEEISRFTELMGEFPGPQAMMMSRMMGMGPSGSLFASINGNNMMGLNGFPTLGIGGGLFMILFWALVIVGIVVGIKFLMNSTQKYSDKDAMEILEERYAKGEIEKKEFDTKKKDLL